ncbi:hypothetical protein [Reyranella sp. CPCC 100927]|uniref:hypothetical protein n=1 Tax=Reyranella sp. CPCC 100927 TaxID=2599616 RepID=UPI0011B39740|nr:hypothetical protein [Reyranella sp. CPCC 100927]TWT15548.1 hypothetical protein FQU96_04125 [Reyranella sp. CPCC 100927]
MAKKTAADPAQHDDERSGDAAFDHLKSELARGFAAPDGTFCRLDADMVFDATPRSRKADSDVEKRRVVAVLPAPTSPGATTQKPRRRR